DVPGQHQDGEYQDARSEDLLPRTGDGAGQGGGEQGDEQRSDGARPDTACNPASASDDPFRRRQDDADNQACFHRFAEHYDHADQHAVVAFSANANDSQYWKRVAAQTTERKATATSTHEKGYRKAI